MLKMIYRALTEAIETSKEEKNTVGDKPSINSVYKSAIKDNIQAGIIVYIMANKVCKTSDIAAFITLSPSRTREFLHKMTENGILETSDGNRNRTYRVKENCGV